MHFFAAFYMHDLRMPIEKSENDDALVTAQRLSLRQSRCRAGLS